jgi:hypothetical protein
MVIYLSVLGRSKLQLFLKYLAEIADIVKACPVTDLFTGKRGITKQGGSHGKSQLYQILVDGLTCIFLKITKERGTICMKFIRKLLYGDFLMVTGLKVINHVDSKSGIIIVGLNRINHFFLL